MLAPRADIHQWGGLLLREIIASGRDKLSQEARNYASWARSDFQWFHRLENPKMPSWNYDFEAAAALLYLDPDFPEPDSPSFVPSLTISSWWVDWLALQIGDARADGFASSCPISRCFDGTETLSSVYAGTRYEAVLAVRLFALRTPSHPSSPDLLKLTGRYLEILATLLSLSSAPWTDPGYRASNGRMWYTGPTWCPVGERSEAAGLQCCQGALLGLMRGTTFKLLRPDAPEYSPVSLYAQIGREFPDSDKLGASAFNSIKLAALPHETIDDVLSSVRSLSSVRLWSETHWVRWPQGLLVWSPRRLNPNTPKVFWGWMDDVARRMTIGYPYPAGKHRGKNASGDPGLCQLNPTPPNTWTITARGIDGGTDASLTLPVSGNPTWHIIGDRDGFRSL